MPMLVPEASHKRLGLLRPEMTVNQARTTANQVPRTLWTGEKRDVA